MASIKIIAYISYGLFLDLSIFFILSQLQKCHISEQYSSSGNILHAKVALCLQRLASLSNLLIRITFSQPFDIIHPHDNQNLVSDQNTSKLFYIPQLTMLACNAATMTNCVRDSGAVGNDVAQIEKVSIIKSNKQSKSHYTAHISQNLDNLCSNVSFAWKSRLSHKPI